MSLMIALAALLALLLFSIKNRQAQEARAEDAYIRQNELFTPAERSFLGVLDQLAGKDFRVFGKVRVADILSPRPGMSRPAWQSAFNKLSRKHFDYVLCAPGDLSILCVIELNDKSHLQKNRQARDEWLIDTCLAAGLPLITFPAQEAYVASEVRARISEALSGQGSAQKKTPPTGGTETPPTCPRCSAPMVRRTAKAGDKAGRDFWGCSTFPKCHEIVEI